MSREELVMYMIGEIGDKYILEALPEHTEKPDEAQTDNVIHIKPAEAYTEISKKELRIYWITHALGMAVVVALIVGAVVLLMQNWDKIAVSGNERPGVVTTVSENNQTPVTDEIIYKYNGCTVKVKDYEFDGLTARVTYDLIFDKDPGYDLQPHVSPCIADPNKEFSGKPFKLVNHDGCVYTWETSCTQYEPSDEITLEFVDHSVSFEDYKDMKNDPAYSLVISKGLVPARIIETDKAIPLTAGNVNVKAVYICENTVTVKCEPSGLTGDELAELADADIKIIMLGGDEVQFALEPNTVNPVMVTADGYAFTGRYNAGHIDTSVIRSVSINGVLIWDNTADPFGQITDTSMPRPFPEWHDTDNAQFEFQWKTKAVGAAMDCRGRENYDEWDRRCTSIRTPYRLDDNNNVAGGIKWFGITAEEIDEYFEERNARWQESLEQAEERGNEGAIMNCRNEIFSEEEINALKSGNDAEIIALFISDYSIWLTGSNYVISPEWLYYHTAEDYAAIGITPQMIAAKIPLYEKTFTGTDNGEDLDEKSWELFKAKLTAYAESAEITDRLAVKTDSMPVPFKPVDSVAPGRMPFYALWQDKFGGDKTVSYIDLGYFFPASSDIAFDNAETPYNIENSYNDLRYAELLGLTNDEPDELIRRRNEIYRGNEGEMTYLDKFLFSDADIEVLLSGDREHIAKHFASDFAIVVGENVFSPQWLYYHTIDDYETAEIAPEAVRELLPRYEEAFTGEAAAMYANSWDVFKRKLTNYAYRETYSFRLAEITSGFDTELFEKSFYGKWEKDGSSSDDNGILLTYRDDMFTFENWIFPRGIAETDELYVMPYINCGVGECYIIKKDAPDELYKGWWNLASYGGGSDEKDVFIINTASDKYVIANRFENDRELHPGDEIGVWGLYKLMGNSAQSAIFSQFCNETGYEKSGGFNGSGSFTDEDGVVWEIAGTKSLPPTNIYYIGGDGRRDLKLAVRYYKQTEFDAFVERDFAYPEPTEHYFLLSFETGLVDGAPVCNVTRTKYSLPAQDDAAVIIDNGIEEEASSDEVTIMEDDEY